MDLEINNGLEVVNIDMSRLQEMKKYNNTIENGALSILEGLDEFCNCMLEKYKDEEVPYDKLFTALKQVISSALDNEYVLNAVLTGVICEKRVKREVKPTRVPERNQRAITNYAKAHTLKEITEHFNFKSEEQARNYLNYKKINYVRSKKRSASYDIEKLKYLAEKIKGRELAKMYGVSTNAMFMLCKRHNIKYRK